VTAPVPILREPLPPKPAEARPEPAPAPPAPPVPAATIEAPLPPVSEPPLAEAARAAIAEPEVNFSEEKIAKPVEPVVKHVKVRSSVDIMAELESLRKRSTQAPPKGKKDALSALDALTSPRKETKSVSVQMPAGAAGKLRRVRIQLVFENGEETPIHTEEHVVSVENSATLQNLLVNLKIDLGQPS
jgi:hypothetical protein